MLYVMRNNAAYMEAVDVMQRAVCAEKDCPNAGPVGSMEVWSVYHIKEQSWKHFAFCGKEHALTCIPVGLMGQA